MSAHLISADGTSRLTVNYYKISDTVLSVWCCFNQNGAVFRVSHCVCCLVQHHVPTFQEKHWFSKIILWFFLCMWGYVVILGLMYVDKWRETKDSDPTPPSSLHNQKHIDSNWSPAFRALQEMWRTASFSFKKQLLISSETKAYNLILSILIFQRNRHWMKRLEH